MMMPSFEETLRRHSIREKRHKIWWKWEKKIIIGWSSWDPDVNVEISDDDWMIERSSSVDESVNFIRSIVGI